MSPIRIPIDALPLVILASQKLRFLEQALAGRYRVRFVDSAGPVERENALAIIAGGDGDVSARLIDACPSLRLIACLTVGYECVDVPHALRRGIPVTNGAGAPTEDVADFALALIVSAARRIADGDRLVRSGRWTTPVPFVTRSLPSLAVGVVGLGLIGSGIARRCAGLRMDVRWWGPRPKPDASWPRAPSLLDLAHDSDVLVLAASSEYHTAPLIDRALLDALGKEGILVNVARGGLLNEHALVEALRDGRLGYAALDVYAQEPTDPDFWADVPNLLLAPHVAGATRETIDRMIDLLCANIDSVLAGRSPVTPIPEMLAAEP
jgi:lactate dehydrogenase-like 2-hydroxyacid dehydrogenase